MGHGFFVYPLRDALNSPSLRRELDEAGLIYPDAAPYGRYPTFDELLMVARSIPGYRVESSRTDDDWQISIEEDVPDRDGIYDGDWVVLEDCNYGDEIAHPYGFWVYRGCKEAIVLVMSYVARTYGPFMVIVEAGDDLILISSETPKEAEWTTARWTEHEEDEDDTEDDF